MLSDTYILDAQPQLLVYARSLTRNRDTAKDLVQDIFERAVRGGWHDGNFRQFMAWARLALERANIDRAAKLKVRHDGRGAVEWLYPPVIPKEVAETAIIGRDFRRAFTAISPAQRQMIALAYHHPDHRAPDQAYTKRLHRARARLRRYMDEGIPDRYASISA